MCNALRLVVIASLALLAACGGRPVVEPDDPHYAPVQPSQMEPPPATRGSLYHANHSPTLFGDRKAYRVGDVITVQLEERTRASNSSSTDLNRSTSVNVATPVIAGRERLNVGANLSSDRDFSGEATSDQSNSLLGSITVTVHEVYPNGNMLVRGEKWMNLNQGSEYVRVSGIVRPEDIRPNNTVSSTQLADARLTYSSTGELANANRQGWLTRFLNSGWWPL
ncbi:flagellar basal body L-ring protein FlgH [Marinospirillum sp.]|uniref:flagellar basal body L-ring protein FlgH n=1 Tax=Marinospirillum sp. TaxID=2183934 RepID=UPI003A8ABB2A